MAYVICGQDHEPSVPIPLVYVFCFKKNKSKPLIKAKSTRVVFSKVLKVLALVEYSPESGPIVTFDNRGPPAPLEPLPVPPFVAVFCRTTRAHIRSDKHVHCADGEAAIAGGSRWSRSDLLKRSVSSL
jgi:hypothetical protein